MPDPAKPDDADIPQAAADDEPLFPKAVADEFVPAGNASDPMRPPVVDPADLPPEPRPDQKTTIIVRYALMQQLGEFSHDLPRPPVPGTRLVVRTERGVELGEVMATISDEPSWRCITSSRMSEYLQASGPDYPFTRGGRVLRIANQQDIIDHRHLQNSAREEGAFARQQIRELNLAMRLVTVEHLLGGERIIFYFSAETRVDFRELVRRLAAQFRTRIEMRQVGARDEARLVADFERCGQRCCCQQYLKDLKPVSMRMAKTQKATLDPSKISGRCSRLMCCLRYEDQGYEELRKLLPRKNIWVRTEKLIGRVVDTQIITQLVRLWLPDNTLAVVANEEIIERDVPAPAMQPAPERREVAHREERPEPKMLRDMAGGSSAAPDGAMAQASQAEGPHPNLKRQADEAQADDAGEADTDEPGVGDDGGVDQEAPCGSKGIALGQPQRNQPHRHGGQNNRPANGQGNQAGGQGQGQGDGGQRRRRRRRHRSRRRGGQGGNGSNGGNAPAQGA